jgi:hypothetical protein
MRTFSICTVVHCWPQGLSSCRSRCLHANYVRYTLMTPIGLQLEYFLFQTLNYSVAILSLFICCFLCFRNPVPHQPFHFTSKECIMYSSVRWQLRNVVASNLPHQRSAVELWSWVGNFVLPLHRDQQQDQVASEASALCWHVVLGVFKASLDSICGNHMSLFCTTTPGGVGANEEKWTITVACFHGFIWDRECMALCGTM